MRVRINFYSERFKTYIKILLIAILVIIEIILCAQTTQAPSHFVNAGLLSNIMLVVCCVALAAVETVDSFVVSKFAAKMIFYGIDAVLLLVICILTGNWLIAALYCMVLTQLYISIEKVKDKLILFGVSCGIYLVSFVIGWVLVNNGATVVDSTVQIFSGALLGLLILAIDFIIVQFVLSFLKTNRELSQALKEADESRAALKEASEQLSATAVFEERNRIAKDIHDNAGHSMTTVIMQTEAAKLLIDKDPEEAKNRIISANIQARNALEQMRESVHLLAGRRNTQSLREELESIITQTIDGTEIKARYDIMDAVTDEDVHRFLCNSLKECLANGIRHGKATAFYIELKEDGGALTMFISDNGSGVDGEIKTGFGLAGMTDGATELGGSCSFTAEKDEGFEVLITLPYKR